MSTVNPSDPLVTAVARLERRVQSLLVVTAVLAVILAFTVLCLIEHANRESGRLNSMGSEITTQTLKIVNEKGEPAISLFSGTKLGSLVTFHDDGPGSDPLLGVGIAANGVPG